MRGTVFKLPETHPHIIISDELDGYVLEVNLSDAAKHPYSPCIILKGEHPAITKDSAVYYRAAKAREVTLLRKNLHRHATVYEEPCSEELLTRIIKGAFHEESQMTLKLRAYLK